MEVFLKFLTSEPEQRKSVFFEIFDRLHSTQRRAGPALPPRLWAVQRLTAELYLWGYGEGLGMYQLARRAASYRVCNGDRNNQLVV